MKTVAIIQARLGSTRLPYKVLMSIRGKSMLERVIERVKKSKVDEVILAAPDKPQDRVSFRNIAKQCGINVFFGSEYDLLDRYYQAATESRADIITRITSDCPCIDPEIIDRTIEYYLSHSFDYVTFGNIANPSVPDYPDGFDVEVFSFNILEQAYQQASLDNREHVGQYMHKNYSYGFLSFNEKLPVKLSIDTIEDLEKVRKIFFALSNGFNIWDVLNFINKEV